MQAFGICPDILAATPCTYGLAFKTEQAHQPCQHGYTNLPASAALLEEKGAPRCLRGEATNMHLPQGVGVCLSFKARTGCHMSTQLHREMMRDWFGLILL